MRDYLNIDESVILKNVNVAANTTAFSSHF